MLGILRLDDGCLMHVLERLAPLPDRFNLAQTCKRMRNLANDPKLWLRVKSEVGLTPSRCANTSKVFDSLTEAVLASRPGDTIAVEGSQSVKNLVIQWPLMILGSNDGIEGNHLGCQEVADAALDVRASMRIVNVSITAHLSACILHRSGHLRVENCHLTCEPRGLGHLCSPLVTLASEVSNSKMGTNGCGGIMTVMDTHIEGGSRAVRCYGTGALSGVRVIYRTNSSQFWFDVDSKIPGKPLPALSCSPRSTIFKRDLLMVCDTENGTAKRKKDQF
ncbi:hypothetical protein BSKO_02388 [Bryopsis sp. KO-2023]|nr:hypothetical protein BSKO_02388 [Bryopsis sp. KO-2023]